MITVATAETEGYRRFLRSAEFFNYTVRVRRGVPPALWGVGGCGARIPAGGVRCGLDAWGPPVSLAAESLPGAADLPRRHWAWERSGEGVMWPEQSAEDRRSGG